MIPFQIMTHSTPSKPTRQLVAEIKPEGEWRVDPDPTFLDRMAALNDQYPYGKWEGNVHDGYRLYATPLLKSTPDRAVLIP